MRPWLAPIHAAGPAYAKMTSPLGLHTMIDRSTARQAGLLAILVLTSWMFKTLESGAARPDQGVRVWVEDSLTRVQPTSKAGSKNVVEIAAARNEVESFQVVVSSVGQKLDGVTASVSDLNDSSGHRISSNQIQLYRQEYVYVRNPSPYSAEPPGWWPDPLVPLVNPYDGKPVLGMRLNREEQDGRVSYTLSGARFPGSGFTVWPGRNQPLWGDVSVPADQFPGAYRGSVSIRLGEGEMIEIPVKLTVWDFGLPDGLPLITQFGSLDGVSAQHGVLDGSPQSIAIQERYAAALEAHRIAAPIPSELLPQIRPNGSHYSPNVS